MDGEPELLSARAAKVGDAIVDRFLPSQRHRLIGAWCFLDVFGTATGQGTGVGPHPHTGIQTATWILEGRSIHRDSIGSFVTVEPGGLALMTAGAGIAHAEEPPPDARTPQLGAQLWIALPEASRAVPPAFTYFDSLPSARRDGARLTLFAGSLGGHHAPGRFYSPIVGAELELAGRASTRVALEERFEHGVVPLRGEARVDGEALPPGTLIFLPPGRRSLSLSTELGATLLLIGGLPFAESILMWWNFVGRNEDEIAEAITDWNGHRRFGEVDGSSLQRIEAPPLPPGRLQPRPAHGSRPL